MTQWYETAKVHVNGVEIPCSYYEYSGSLAASGQGSATLAIRPTPDDSGAWPVFVRGDRVDAWFGKWDAAGNETLYQKVKGGRIQSVRFGSHATPTGVVETLDLQIDATDVRLLLAPSRDEERRDLTFSELLRWLFVEGMGFAGVFHNLQEFNIPDPVRASVKATWVSLVGPYLQAFSPRFVPMADGTLWIVDTRRGVTPVAGAIAKGPGEWASLDRTTSEGRVVNSVEILTYRESGDPGPGVRYEDDEVLVGANMPANILVLGATATASPDGYPRTVVKNRRRKYFENPHVDGVPDVPTRIVIRGKVVDREDAFGTVVGRIITTNEYVANTADTLEQRVTEEHWALVRTPGAGEGYAGLVDARWGDAPRLFVRTAKVLRTNVWWRDTTTNRYRPVSEDTLTTAEVLADQRVRLDEASRNGTTTGNPGEMVEFMDVEHERRDYHYSAAGEVSTVWGRVDLLSGEVLDQGSDSHLGAGETEANRPTEKTVREDAASLQAPPLGDGRRPQETFDGRAFGLAMSDRIVADHVFAALRNDAVSETIVPAAFDPRLGVGMVLALDDGLGGASVFDIVVSEHHVVDVSAQHAETSLGCERLPVLA